MFKKYLPTAAIAALATLMPMAGHAQIVVDGTVDGAYGPALAAQNAPTNYGKNLGGKAAPTPGGSELDAAYAVIKNKTLYVMLTGNLENNTNVLNLFIATGAAGGQNTLHNTGGGTTGLNGLTFDKGVAPNYDLFVNATATNLYASIDTLNGRGTSVYLGNTATFGARATGTLTGGTNPFKVRAALNDSHAGGKASPKVKTGIEFGIPLSAIGTPRGPIRLIALIAGKKNIAVSNQALGGAGAGLNGYPKPSAVNFSRIAGNQYFTVAAPAR